MTSDEDTRAQSSGVASTSDVNRPRRQEKREPDGVDLKLSGSGRHPAHDDKATGDKSIDARPTAGEAPDDVGGANVEPRGDRIAKFLSRAGIVSRRDAEKMLIAGAVKLNGQTVTHPATFVSTGDIVQVNGRVVEPPDRTRMWRYHKPEGLVTTHRDPQGRPTVFDKLRQQLPRVISVGRLDLASEGLLLLTNDGALARRLELPTTGWIRRYRVRVFGLPEPAALEALARGVTVAGVRYGPIEAAVDARKGDNTWLSISLREGRNREVRRVMAHLGLSVSRLIRIAYGPFQLGTLERGGIDEVPARVLREQLPADAVPRPPGRRPR